MKRSLTCVDPDANVDKFWCVEYTPGSAEFTYSYGRNGTAGSGPKVKRFASPDDAQKAAEKALQEKLAAGYVDADDTTTPAVKLVSTAPKPTFRPMLFNKIDAGVHLPTKIRDDGVVIESKLNGDRIVIVIENGEVTVLGKDGQVSQRRPLFADRFHAPDLAVLAGQCETIILDGELVDGKLWLFDMPRLVLGPRRIDIADPWFRRRDMLEHLFGVWNPNPTYFGLLPYAEGTEAKQELVDRCRAEQGEGVMVKLWNAPYKCGPRRGTGGFKAKFWKTASFIVKEIDVDGHHNAVLELLDENDKPVVVGRCSLNGKGIVLPGMIVEVRYLYFEDAIVQPDLIMIRTDVQRSECLLSQLVGTNKKVVTR